MYSIMVISNRDGECELRGTHRRNDEPALINLHIHQSILACTDCQSWTRQLCAGRDSANRCRRFRGIFARTTVPRIADFLTLTHEAQAQQ